MNRRRFLKFALGVVGVPLVIPNPTGRAQLTPDQVLDRLDRRLRSGLRQSLEEEFHDRQDELQELFTLAKDGDAYDFARKAVLEKLEATDQRDAMAKVRARNQELEDLGRRLEAGCR